MRSEPCSDARGRPQRRTRRRRGCLLVAVVATAAAGGCRSDPSKDVLAAVEANVKASQREDLAAYAGTLDADAPGFEERKIEAKETFDEYDLSYELAHATVVSVSKDQARVKFVLV